MNSFDEYEYKRKISAAIDQVKLILEANRTLKPPDSVEHRYDDKYSLAETLTQSALQACQDSLSLL
jgi:hypothetical protein